MLGPKGALSGNVDGSKAGLVATGAEAGGDWPTTGGTGLLSGVVEQAARVPTIASNIRIFVMTLLILEALGALLILVLIVWWTMFAGRNKGELPAADPHSASEDLKK